MSDVLLSMVSSGRAAQQSGKSDTGVSSSADRSVNGFNQALESAQRQASQARPDTSATRQTEHSASQQADDAKPAAASSQPVKQEGDARTSKAEAATTGGNDLPEDAQSAAAAESEAVVAEGSGTDVTNEANPSTAESVEATEEGDASAAEAANANAMNTAIVAEALQPGQTTDTQAETQVETTAGKSGVTLDAAGESTLPSQGESAKSNGVVIGTTPGMSQEAQSVRSAAQTDISKQASNTIPPDVAADQNPNGKAAAQPLSTVASGKTAVETDGASLPKQSEAAGQDRQAPSQPSASKGSGDAQTAATASQTAVAPNASPTVATEASARGASGETSHNTATAGVNASAGQTQAVDTKVHEGVEPANKAQSAHVSSTAALATGGAQSAPGGPHPAQDAAAKAPMPADHVAKASGAAVVTQSGNKETRDTSKPTSGVTKTAGVTGMTVTQGATPAGPAPDQGGADVPTDNAHERLARTAEQVLRQGPENEAARTVATAKGVPGTSSAEVKAPTAEPIITGQPSEPATAERTAPLPVSLSPVAQALARMHQLTESAGSADAATGDAMDSSDAVELTTQSSNANGKPSLLEQLALLRGLRLPPARESHALQGAEGNSSTLLDPARLGSASPLDAALPSNAGKPSTPAQPLVTTLQASVFQAQWAPELGQKLAMMISQQINEAEIRLDPPELGPMRVNIKMQNEQANVTFTSHSAAVRETLEQAMPRLRDMLEQQGLGLGDANVRDQSSRQGQGQQEQGEGLAGLPGETVDEALADAEAHLTQRSTASRLVDYYA